MSNARPAFVEKRRFFVLANNGRVDFFGQINRIEGGKVAMKGFFKFLLALLTLGAAFYVGHHLGKEKEKSKIPIFQEEPEVHE
jgi:hypothetical protein